jgi:hypothetical protein
MPVKGKDNSMFYLLLGIFIIAIIIGSVMVTSFNNREKFANNNNKLVYLYMEGCHHCENFSIVWENIKSKIQSNPDKYTFSAEKYDLNDGSTGSNYSKTYDVHYAPAILFIKDNNKDKNEYNGSRTVDEVLNWAVKQK